MEYPINPKSRPLTGKAARKVLNAMKSGKGITNPAYERTIRQIVDELKEEHSHVKKSKAVRKD